MLRNPHKLFSETASAFNKVKSNKLGRAFLYGSTTFAFYNFTNYTYVSLYNKFLELEKDSIPKITQWEKENPALVDIEIIISHAFKDAGLKGRTHKICFGDTEALMSISASYIGRESQAITFINQDAMIKLRESSENAHDFFQQLYAISAREASLATFPYVFIWESCLAATAAALTPNFFAFFVAYNVLKNVFKPNEFLDAVADSKAVNLGMGNALLKYYSNAERAQPPLPPYPITTSPTHLLIRRKEYVRSRLMSDTSSTPDFFKSEEYYEIRKKQNSMPKADSQKSTEITHKI